LKPGWGSEFLHGIRAATEHRIEILLRERGTSPRKDIGLVFQL
jgi:hypothetical protein